MLLIFFLQKDWLIETRTCIKVVVQQEYKKIKNIEIYIVIYIQIKNVLNINLLHNNKMMKPNMKLNIYFLLVSKC